MTHDCLYSFAQPICSKTLLRCSGTIFVGGVKIETVNGNIVNEMYGAQIVCAFKNVRGSAKEWKKIGTFETALSKM